MIKLIVWEPHFSYMLFVTTEEGTLYKLDSFTGEQIWSNTHQQDQS